MKMSNAQNLGSVEKVLRWRGSRIVRAIVMRCWTKDEEVKVVVRQVEFRMMEILRRQGSMEHGNARQ